MLGTHKKVIDTLKKKGASEVRVIKAADVIVDAGEDRVCQPDASRTALSRRPHGLRARPHTSRHSTITIVQTMPQPIQVMAGSRSQ